jgi:hypothetical protein
MTFAVLNSSQRRLTKKLDGRQRRSRMVGDFLRLWSIGK